VLNSLGTPGPTSQDLLLDQTRAPLPHSAASVDGPGTTRSVDAVRLRVAILTMARRRLSVMVVAGLLAFAGGAHAEVFYSSSVDVDPLSKRVTLGLEYAATENEPMAGKIVRACWSNRYGRRVCLSKAIPEPLGTDSSQIIFQRVRPRVVRNMRQRTTFTWYVQGAQVASKRVRVR
jgi:hypothetical protein